MIFSTTNSLLSFLEVLHWPYLISPPTLLCWRPWCDQKTKMVKGASRYPSCGRCITLQGFCVPGKPQKRCLSDGGAKEMLLATKVDVIISCRKIFLLRCCFAVANTNVCSCGFSRRYFQVFTGRDTSSPQRLDEVSVRLSHWDTSEFY